VAQRLTRRRDFALVFCVPLAVFCVPPAVFCVPLAVFCVPLAMPVRNRNLSVAFRALAELVARAKTTAVSFSPGGASLSRRRRAW